jgi:hypothetical protein
MPEKMTKEEAKIYQTIRAVRKAKELLIQGDNDVIEYDGLGETIKVKEPKADKADKITNQTQDEEGFGLAGEMFGKATYGSRWRKNEGKGYDSKKSMLDEIHDRWNDISMELNEGVTKQSMVDLINVLTGVTLITEAEMVDDTYYDGE